MFRTLNRVILVLFFFSCVTGEDLEYNYIENGADWPNDFPDCSGPN
jgi:hypothetical protein